MFEIILLNKASQQVKVGFIEKDVYQHLLYYYDHLILNLKILKAGGEIFSVRSNSASQLVFSFLFLPFSLHK